MHPNAYLKSLWRNSFEPQVFVAMSFDERFNGRFTNVIQPAIEEMPIGGKSLKAIRVDITKSGESILTEISNGIAHSFLVLADVSSIDVGRFGGKPIRNSNVSYEVGVALACRSPEEVLLIRDDSDPLIFDTSSIPHLTIDFDNATDAIEKIRAALQDRARERDIQKDARTMTALSHLTPDDLDLLRALAEISPDQSADLRIEPIPGRKMMAIPTAKSLENLLRIDLVVAHALTADNSLTYKLTDIGRSVAGRFKKLLVKNEIADAQS